MALVKLKTHRCPTLSHLTEALEESFQAAWGGGEMNLHIYPVLYISTVDVPPQINVNGMHTLLIRSVGCDEGFENLQLMMLQLLLLMSCKTLNE